MQITADARLKQVYVFDIISKFLKTNSKISKDQIKNTLRMHDKRSLPAIKRRRKQRRSSFEFGYHNQKHQPINKPSLRKRSSLLFQNL